MYNTGVSIEWGVNVTATIIKLGTGIPRGNIRIRRVWRVKNELQSNE